MKDSIIRESDISISTQLYDILRKTIIEKKWKENQKYYSVRQLSIRYNVNPNTVLKVIHILEDEGYLYSVKGKGCFIKKGYNNDISVRMTPILNTFKFGQFSKETEINLSNGAPPKEFFPIKDYNKLLNEILNDKENINSLMGYQNIQGLESLREVLSDFTKKYGIISDKNNMILCSGTQMALQLISTSFGIIPKKTIALSNPTYQNAIFILKNFCDIEYIDLQYDGWNMKEFENLLKNKKIDFVYIMTNFQNPTGISWSFVKKRHLLALAEKFDFYIIEDECFSDFFYYSQKTPHSLKALDKNDRVFFIKTFSKIVMPGISLALFIPPKKYIENLSLNKYFIETTTSGINQKFLEFFIKRGLLDKHLSNLRNVLKEKMDFTLNLLQNIKHIEVIFEPKGGFFIWLKLAHYIDSEKFYYKCKLRGLSILPSFVFSSTTKELKSRIRISIVSASMQEIKKGVEIIEDILNHCENLDM